MILGIDQAACLGAAEGVLATDLLCGADELATQLRGALREGQWLDAYLLAAGLGQLVEDRLHADPLLLNRAASYLSSLPSRPARLAGAASAAAGAALRVRPAPGRQRLVRARHAIAGLTGLLAAQVLGPQPAGPLAEDPAPLLDAIEDVRPALAGDVPRIPTCFHSFDQHPDDVRWLAREFRLRYPGRGRPLCVVGVRTSGSYLAPLHAAALRATGDDPVQVLTYRPGRPFLRGERSVLEATARAGGLVLVVDDPPGTGSALAETARAVAAAGVPDPAIILLLPLFGSSDEPPELLRRWQAVVQPWADWSVHSRLAAQPVAETLAALLPRGIQVCEVERLDPPWPARDRGHARAMFMARLLDGHSGESVYRRIMVEGAGLGYLGRQGAAVASAIPGQVPHVYGFANGLIYRDWLPPGGYPDAGDELAETVAGYVNARRQALPAPSGGVDRMGGRDPAWEVAARQLSRQFGALTVPARPLLCDPLVRRLLRHDQPTVLDGKTDLRHWLADPAAGGAPRKVDFYQRAFGHLDLACYDPVCDLAGAAADPPSPGFEARLREAYERASGQQVDGERWLLYRLAQLWRLGYGGDIDTGRIRQQSAAAVHDYLAGLYLRGLPPATGELCAIDLDGVLECDRLGYPATSPTGALALRALVAHGYRPVLATGRAVPDVRDRCTAFGLVGGVAEYGCALVYEGEAVDLRPPPARALLDRLRGELARYPGIRVDPQTAYAVRAKADGGPVPAELLARVPALAGRGVQVIQGQGQTDFIAAGIDKGTGLRALAGLLGRPGCALAVGDSPPDLPMFACAALARAPRNARLGAGGSWIKLTRRAYQAGLSQACAGLIGHRPGSCPACRPPEFPPRTRAMLAILDLRADGLASIPPRTMTLYSLLIRKAA
jgi:hydroxymethylpyrimidine pyrophosphatase-like HAD family hydrolase